MNLDSLTFAWTFHTPLFPFVMHSYIFVQVYKLNNHTYNTSNINNFGWQGLGDQCMHLNRQHSWHLWGLHMFECVSHVFSNACSIDTLYILKFLCMAFHTPPLQYRVSVSYYTWEKESTARISISQHNNLMWIAQQGMTVARLFNVFHWQALVG